VPSKILDTDRKFDAWEFQVCGNTHNLEVRYKSPARSGADAYKGRSRLDAPTFYVTSKSPPFHLENGDVSALHEQVERTLEDYHAPKQWEKILVVRTKHDSHAASIYEKNVLHHLKASVRVTAWQRTMGRDGRQMYRETERGEPGRTQFGTITEAEQKTIGELKDTAVAVLPDTKENRKMLGDFIKRLNEVFGQMRKAMHQDQFLATLASRQPLLPGPTGE
jgi:hypothetical protein